MSRGVTARRGGASLHFVLCSARPAISEDSRTIDGPVAERSTLGEFTAGEYRGS